MHQADVQIATMEDGTKALTLADPHSGINVRVFLPPSAAEQIAAALSPSAVLVAPASALPQPETKH